MKFTVSILLALAALFAVASASPMCSNGNADKFFKTSEHQCQAIVSALGDFMYSDETAILNKLSASSFGDGQCSIGDGLECASKILACKDQCTQGLSQCVGCLGSAWSQCCPCINKIIHKDFDCST